MQEIILATMFWEQVHTAFLCMMLTVVSALYISILPWRNEDLLRCHQAFLASFTSKFRQTLDRNLQRVK